MENNKMPDKKLALITYPDIEALACYILDLDWDEIEGDTSTINEKIQEKFGCNIDQFFRLLQVLLPTINVGVNYNDAGTITKIFVDFMNRKEDVSLVRWELGQYLQANTNA